MCLLDAVVVHDAARIVCVTGRHLDPANPLREEGRLTCMAAIELAAQAMAAHGALLAPGGPRALQGWLARVRDCVFQFDSMDALAAPLTIEAVRQAGGASALAYRFSVRAGDDVVATGSALIALAVPPASA